MLLSVAMIDEFAESFLCDVQKLKDENWNIGEQEWIHRSYPHFIRFFEEKETLNEHDVMIGRFLSYGWMPKILRNLGHLSKKSDLIKYLNKAKNHERPSLTSEEIEHIASCINNSVTGASKLLHFINPEYPIWDDNVRQYLYGYNTILNKIGINFPEKMNHGEQAIKENRHLYEQYLIIISNLSKDDKLYSTKNVSKKKLQNISKENLQNMK